MTDSTERRVSLDRTAPATFTATNARGGTISMCDGRDDSFTPVELLLAAIAGCSAMDVEAIVGKRAEPTSIKLSSRGDKIRDEAGNHMVDLVVDFAEVTFPETPEGEKAEQVLVKSTQMSRDRLCTVSRTVQLGAPVRYQVRGETID